jgi:ribosomal protein RSM22 (predicted rRNA methylase)
MTTVNKASKVPKLVIDGLGLKDFIKKDQNYIGLVHFPAHIKADIEKQLKPFNRRMLKTQLDRFKLSFNSHKTITPMAMKYGHLESMTNLAYMPVFYAPLHNIFNQLRNKNADFKPSSVLDFGSGPGTAILAAKEFYDIKSAVAIDSSQQQLDLCSRFMALKENADIAFETKLSEKEKWSTPGQFDLVVSSFVLTELANDTARKSVVEELWRKTSDVLVLVDRGTPFASRLIQAARQQILDLAKREEKDVHILAPVLTSDLVYP